MRALVFLLVFANLLAFALSGVFSGPAARDADPAHAPLSPDRIRVVSRGEAVPLAAPPATASAPAAASAVAAVNGAAPLCLVWKGVAAAEAERLAKAATEGGLQVAQVEVPGAARLTHWVAIPPLASGKAGAERKVAELRRLGVEETFILSEPGPDQWAVSLGMFSSEAAAEDALAALRKKGVRSARLAALPTPPARQDVTLRGPADKVEALRGLLATAPPASCPAPAAAGAALSAPASAVASSAAARLSATAARR